MQQGLVLGTRIVKRVIMTFSIVIVNAISQWTYSNMSAVQALCLVSLVFLTAIQISKKAAEPKLFRLICLLYCNQQVRRLFISNDNTAVTLFPNIMLAVALAVLLVSISDKDDTGSLDDLRVMLEGLLYMYGDIMDFAFEYGILPLTIASFGVGLVLRHLEQPTDPIIAFVRRLLGIISTNILYQGVTSLINSTTQTKLIESIAATSIIRLILPSMESYLTYMTAARLAFLMPGVAPIMLCAILWIEMLPVSSRGWVGELFATYVIIAVINYMILIPTWGAVVVLIIAHYIDYIIFHLDCK